MAEEVFHSPQPAPDPEVRSPNAATALEGEVSGPNYGSIETQAQARRNVMVNGAPEVGSSSSAAPALQDLHRRGYLDAAGRVALNLQEEPSRLDMAAGQDTTPGPGATAGLGAITGLGATAGLDAMTGLRATTGPGTTARIIRGDARIEGNPETPQRSVVSVQPQQSPDPQLHQSSPLSMHNTPQ